MDSREGPEPSKNMTMNLVDTRVFGRPKSWNGERETWREFSFSMNTFIGAISPSLHNMLRQAMALVEPIGHDRMVEAHIKLDFQLWHILAMTVEGKALIDVRSAPEGTRWSVGGYGRNDANQRPWDARERH